MNAQSHSVESPSEPSALISSDPEPDAETSKFLQKLNLLRERFPKLPGDKPWHRRPLIWVGLGVLSLGAGGIAYGGWKFHQLYESLPEVTDLSAFNREGTLTLKAADNSILIQTGPATRDKVQLKNMPDLLVQGFVAVEDRRFERHTGVDYQGVLRAIANNVMARSVVEGGSTITQQLARIVFLDQEQSMTRKLREALLAQKMEKQMTKDDILERYLNLVYLGSGAYGVADAAWVYFSKPVQQLNLSEIATLVGLPPAPSEYSPLVDLKAAQSRRNVVLGRMNEAGLISEAQAKSAISQSLTINPSSPKRLEVKAPYFVGYIQKELSKYVSAEALEQGGLTVETSVNLKWQDIAQDVVQDAVRIDGSAQGFDQAALVALDPRNGEVKALVGGADFKESEFNRAFQAQRQPGSTFKGLVYATAISAGFSPYDSYMDEPYRVDGYRPMNYSKKHSGWQSMSSALSNSLNVIAVKVLVDVGFEPTIKMAQSMGIHSKLQPTYALALGAYEVNLLELTNAYGTLAAEGKNVPAHGIRKVINSKGEVIYQADFQPKPVMDKGSAAIATWMLEGVIEEGTGRAARLSDRHAAGKTGTSESYRDLWFVGYIPQVAAGIWLGNDDNRPTWGVSETAAYNWREFMQRVTKDMAVQDLPKVPELEGRKGSIKAKAVKPARIQNGDSAVHQEDPDYNEYFSKRQSDYSSESYNSEGNSNYGYESSGYRDDGYSENY
ncbi:MAG: PBP1A family penicillin-binding protein [Oscillatoriales cyanobacterium RM2_1_1]|nr:PBP1A family penicillin-binding protein [Oscillatoriales cyanobacterium SM2_3_0]NJO46718.1 PBP1A family penicillin-binding protein [Oscillatoriales cyanobacterium RM2_1_1]